MKFKDKNINTGEAGTILNAELLEKANWREDNSLSFKKLEDDTLPAPILDKTQIITKANGKTI